MEFLKKLYHVKISGKKSVANHKQPTISNSHLLSDYSDDEESIPVISYRQKNTAKRSQSRKKDQKIKQTLLSFSTIDSKQDQIIPVHTRDEKEKSSNNDQKVSDSHYYSTLYSPFAQRPEIMDDDYIPLPTVTRNYIDPPPDSIIDSLQRQTTNNQRKPRDRHYVPKLTINTSITL